MRIAAIAAVVLLAFGRLSAAQVPGGATPSDPNQDVRCGEFPDPGQEIAALRKVYYSGNWHELQRKTRDLLKSCHFVADGNLGIDAGPLDLRTHFVFVVIPVTNGGGDPAALRYLVRDPDPHPFTTRLPGIGPELLDSKTAKPRPHVFQVLLSPITGAVLTTTFASTEQADPLVAQLPDLVKAAVDPSMLLPMLQGALPALTAPSVFGDIPEEAPPPPTVIASLARLSLPHERGDVKVQDIIKVPAGFTGDSIRTLMMMAQTTRRDLSTPPQLGAAAMKLSEDLYVEVRELAAGNRAKELSTRSLVCDSASWQGQCWKAAEKLLTTVAQTHCNGKPCTGETLAVLERYKKVLPAPTPISGTTTLLNAPLTRVTLGVMSGILLTAEVSQPRAKVDGGKISEDPLPRHINIVAVQLHKPHDASLVKPSRAEQFRGFVGSVITPSFGVAAGLGWAPIRNLSVNAGYAWLLIRTKKDTETFGQPPVDKSQPFEPASAHGTFFSLGYKFK